MKRPLILVGGGGHCKSVIEAAESVGYTIKGILDIPLHVGDEVLGYTIIGTDNDIPLYVKKYDFIVTVGFFKDVSLRISLHNKIEEAGGRFATIIASTAHVSKYADLGIGTVVLHQACVNAGTKIGKGCIINTFANIEHDVIIGDYCHISTGAMINGDCKIGANTFIGSQSVLLNTIKIADNVIVGAGSVVINSLFQKGIYVGNPVSMKDEIDEK